MGLKALIRQHVRQILTEKKCFALQKSLRHGDFSASVLPAVLRHPPLLSLHLLQAAEQQEEAFKEQEFEEEKHLRKGAPQENNDQSDAGADGDHLWGVLAALEHYQHPRRL